MLGERSAIRPAGDARRRGTSAMPRSRELHKMTDSQLGSERPQTRDAICVT
jgi:hypothetical protein